MVLRPQTRWAGTGHSVLNQARRTCRPPPLAQLRLFGTRSGQWSLRPRGWPSRLHNGSSETFGSTHLTFAQHEIRGPSQFLKCPWKPEKAKGKAVRASCTDTIFVDFISTDMPRCLDK